jgi:small subunit ribosomal protein S20
MANHKSALKRIRQNEKRRLYNRDFRNRARTLIKKARKTVTANNPDLDAAENAARDAIRDLDKAASRGVLHPRNAARRKSRLMKQLAALKSAQ